MVLGNYYLTMEEEGREGEGMVFRDQNEAVIAWRNGYVHLHSRIGVNPNSLGENHLLNGKRTYDDHNSW